MGLRLAGAPLRRTSPVLLRGVGWILCATATWAVAGAAGAWFPLWPAAAVGLVGAVLGGRADRQIPSRREWAALRPIVRPSAWLIADAAILAMAAIHSFPWLEDAWAARMVGALTAWWALEVVLTVRKPPLRLAAGVAGGLVLVLAVMEYRPRLDPLRPPLAYLPFAGATADCGGVPLRLSTGHAAWLNRPSGHSGLGALVFHGAHPQGSRQPAACVLRRALVDAGYTVLAVDHAGFGQSPAPAIDAPLDAWDPMAADLAALARLRSEPGVRSVIAVGHSMGTQDAVRLVAQEDIALAILFGAADTPRRDEDYSYMRFHRDRGLSDTLPRARWEEITLRFYDWSRVLDQLTAGHPLVIFGVLEHEWPNLKTWRMPTYNRIPEPARLWTVQGASHYFSSSEISGVVVGDTRVSNELVEGFRQVAARAELRRE